MTTVRHALDVIAHGVRSRCGGEQMTHQPGLTRGLVLKVTAVVVCTLLYVGQGSVDAIVGVGIVLLAALAVIRDAM